MKTITLTVLAIGLALGLASAQTYSTNVTYKTNIQGDLVIQTTTITTLPGVPPNLLSILTSNYTLPNFIGTLDLAGNLVARSVSSVCSNAAAPSIVLSSTGTTNVAYTNKWTMDAIAYVSGSSCTVTQGGICITPMAASTTTVLLQTNQSFNVAGTNVAITVRPR